MGVEEGKVDPSLEQGEDSVGDLVDGQVLSYIVLGGRPHEGSCGRVELC